MKILICNDLVYGGGAETLLRTFVKVFVNRGYRVTVMASPNSKKDFSTAFPAEVHCFRGRWPKRTNKSNTFQYAFNALFRKVYRLFIILKVSLLNFDLVIAFKEGRIMKDVSSLRAKRKIAWIQCDVSTLHQQHWYKDIFPSIDKERKCVQSFEKVICVSETVKESVIKSIGNTENLFVRYNPIDVKKILQLSKEKCEYCKENGRRLIVSVGRLDPVKNYITLLEASSLLSNKIDFDLWIVGDGPQREELEAYILEKDLKNIKLLGFQKNPFSILVQADLFVSSSVSEGYGLSVQEALILGVPVIAVKCSGIEETLDTRFGVLVDNSPEKMANAIETVLDNSDKLESFRKEIKEKYPLDNLFQDRMNEICRLLEE